MRARPVTRRPSRASHAGDRCASQQSRARTRLNWIDDQEGRQRRQHGREGERQQLLHGAVAEQTARAEREERDDAAKRHAHKRLHHDVQLLRIDQLLQTVVRPRFPSLGKHLCVVCGLRQSQLERITNKTSRQDKKTRTDKATKTMTKQGQTTSFRLVFDRFTCLVAPPNRIDSND